MRLLIKYCDAVDALLRRYRGQCVQGMERAKATSISPPSSLIRHRGTSSRLFIVNNIITATTCCEVANGILGQVHLIAIAPTSLAGRSQYAQNHMHHLYPVKTRSTVLSAMGIENSQIDAPSASRNLSSLSNNGIERNGRPAAKPPL